MGVLYQTHLNNWKFELSSILPEIRGQKVVCTIWEDVRTYLTSEIDPKEKAELIVAFAHFKKEEKQ